MTDTRATSDRWWKAAVVYQVYPRSFADSDGDGMGDLRGIIEHVDHIADLGVDVVWLSPVYRSPQDDNGYDISDYQDVDPMFGTLEDLDELMARLHERGIKLLMDLVVNHTSDEHPWFAESRSGRDNPRADWYIWRDPRPGLEPGTPGAEPNNWGSVFSGPAWEWVPERGQYYLHLFSRKQPDLNWENSDVRRAVFTMMRWWLDRGVDGFRMDVVNLLSKPDGLPDAPVGAGSGPGRGLGDGLGQCTYGPRIHDYLAEMKREVLTGREGILTVGEMPGVTPEQAVRFTDRDSGQVDMVFQFEHVDLDHEGSKWVHRPVGAVDLKRSLARWQAAMGDRGWNSLYLSNHDQPRPVSRFGNDRVGRDETGKDETGQNETIIDETGAAAYWRESATALGTLLHLHRGTPYVYQGEELGMTNVPFDSIEDFADIESLNHYRTAVDQLGEDPEVVLAALRRAGRDNARTPMQWSSEAHAGFTSGTPWLPANQNHTWLNAEAQQDDPRSVLAHYRALIQLRHTEPVVVDGDFALREPDHEQLYAFTRSLGEQCLAVYVNMSDEPVTVDVPAGEVLLGNYVEAPTAGRLRPWEAVVVRVS